MLCKGNQLMLLRQLMRDKLQRGIVDRIIFKLYNLHSELLADYVGEFGFGEVAKANEVGANKPTVCRLSLHSVRELFGRNTPATNK
jgi:hypothetical protein